MDALLTPAPAASPSALEGRLILLTGISGSGKTTLGRLLVAELQRRGARPASLVDGDRARSFFEGGLGYGVEEREDATRRMAFGAYTLVRAGYDVVMANIAGSARVRRFLRKKFPEMVEVFLDQSLEAAIGADVKGIYAKALQLDEPQIVGLDLPYERPTSPDITLHPGRETPEESLTRLVQYLSTRGPTLGTKAHTLASLRGRLRHGVVLPQVTLSFDAWRGNGSLHLEEMRTSLASASTSGRVIVRSSCPDEDTNDSSNAGQFTSVLDVPLELESLGAALREVRDDYAAQGLDAPDHQQILVQPMLSGVRMSGVVFTRHRSSDSPYYVVNYDDETGKTDTVTGGAGGKTLYLSRFLDEDRLGEWSGLAALVAELEGLFAVPLDLEFAQDQAGQWVVLQCRRLHVSEVLHSLEESAGLLLTETMARFERLQAPAPPQVGEHTVLSDMADWNPAEMLGERPSTLAYSLYRTLLTDEVWHRARASQGYFELSSAPLIVSVARKAYVDVRASFNSFTPRGLAPALREKLVDAWTSKLQSRPELHDKVEFEVACTAFDLQTKEKLSALGTLEPDEVNEVAGAYLALTNALVTGHGRWIAEDDARLSTLESLTESVHASYGESDRFHEAFQAAWLHLGHLKDFGTTPFARLARLGFVAKGLVDSLETAGVVPSGFAAELFAGFETVATRLGDALGAVQSGSLEVDAFLREFGHLRMSTYDLTAPRYDQLPKHVWTQSESTTGKGGRASGAEGRVSIGADLEASINEALEGAGLSFTAPTLFAFAEAATVAREAGKFRFTRTLSRALECLASAGEALDLSRQELQCLTLPTLVRFRNPENASPAKAAAYLRDRAREKRQERSVFDLMELPSVIARPSDLERVAVLDSRPNFITTGRVRAEVVVLGPNDAPGDQPLRGKIVAIRAADPGYDWIFSQEIAGLVTQFGGVASHMAIRCFEFGIPGAIGCGEARFESIADARIALIDGSEGVLARA
jgi:adenylylsulfate kinase-like enzyme/phosphohistidine swiveling domain-containing protein